MVPAFQNLLSRDHACVVYERFVYRVFEICTPIMRSTWKSWKDSNRTRLSNVCDSSAGVSWIQFGKAVIGWILTIIIVGLLAGIFTALGVFAPSLRASQTIAKLRTSVKDASSNQIGAVAKTCKVRLISDCFLLVEHCVNKSIHVPSSLVFGILNFMMGGRAWSMDGVSMFIGDYSKPQ
jgi:hypothetical protein